MNDKGTKYEKIARKFLQNKGLTIIKLNFSTRRGEIDIIALNKDWLCFVEVRYRAQNLDTAIESVNNKKAEKIQLAAQEFLEQNQQFENYKLRFDLVAISSYKLTNKFSLQYFKNFF